MARNANIGKLQAGYLFPEIARLRSAHLAENPEAKIISLGIGDTTEPIPEPIVNGMVESAKGLGTMEGYGKYGGYGAEQGQGPLREAIAKRFYSNVSDVVDEGDIFVSDGSKCDIGRLQMCFGSGKSVSVQGPSYPAYVDTSVIIGNTVAPMGVTILGSTWKEYVVVRGSSPTMRAIERAVWARTNTFWDSSSSTASSPPESRRDRPARRPCPEPGRRRRRASR